MDKAIINCKVCGSKTIYLETITGKWDKKAYNLFKCPSCLLIFIGNPDRNYKEIYTHAITWAGEQTLRLTTSEK
jgi:hypothetical protein